MKNYKILIFFLLALILSCQKENKFIFPQGEWVLKEFVILGGVEKGYSCTFNQEKFESLIGNCFLSFDGDKHLTFISNNTDKLKIIDLKNEQENLFFTPNNYFPYYLYEDLSSNNQISITLRTKKFKKLKFKYFIVNDSTLIGEFWVKNQSISRYDAPNFCSGSYKLSDINVKGETEINFNKEILGVYHLKK